MKMKMDNGLGDTYCRRLFPQHLYVRQSGHTPLLTTGEHLKHYWDKSDNAMMKMEDVDKCQTTSEQTVKIP